MSEVEAQIEQIKQGFYLEPTVPEKKVRPELFDQVARKLGRGFAQGNTRVSSNQLRGFYGEVKALEMKFQEMSRRLPERDKGEGGIADQVFQQHEYLVRMIIPKVAYIQGKRTGGNVSREFRDFIETAIDQVQNADDFTVFMRIFESVVGFFYGYGGGKSR